MTGIARRFGRFSLVGLMGAGLQVLLILLFTKQLDISAALATSMAVEITIVHNFMWHEHFTWTGRGHRGTREVAVRLWRFHVGNGLISLAGNTVLMYWLVERLQVPVVPATLGAIGTLALVNFFIAERWVFADALSRDGSNPVATRGGASHHLLP